MKVMVGRLKENVFGERSGSPGLKKVSFYGVDLYNLGQVRFFPYDKANSLNSIEVLKQLRAEFPEMEMTLIWDGAPYHRSGAVKTAIAPAGDCSRTFTCLQS